MIILDTNVLSALMSPSPVPAVTAWLNRQRDQSVWTTAVAVFEIRSGIDVLPIGRRRQLLDEAFARVLADDLQGRVLPFDSAAADAAGALAVRRKLSGFTDDIRDIQIAGIVLARSATLATRNERDFRDLGAKAVNPWSV
jgi:predicted nucleic acid-binding protein